jgi:hypothetical protein
MYSSSYCSCSVQRLRSLPPKVWVWPKPASISFSSSVYALLSPSFSIRSSPSHPSLRHAIAFYTRLIKSERHLPLVPTSNYTISLVPIRHLALSDLHVPLGPGVDESYTLSVTPNSPSADISAATPWGAIRGLETFSQLSSAGPTPAASRWCPGTSRSRIAHSSPTAASSSTPRGITTPLMTYFSHYLRHGVQ